MSDLVTWTWIMGGTPLILALILRTAEWLHNAVCAGPIAWHSAAKDRPASDSGLWWTHA
jgi:hypothetical protein